MPPHGRPGVIRAFCMSAEDEFSDNYDRKRDEGVFG